LLFTAGGTTPGAQGVEGGTARQGSRGMTPRARGAGAGGTRVMDGRPRGSSVRRRTAGAPGPAAGVRGGNGCRGETNRIRKQERRKKWEGEEKGNSTTSKPA
jgi:hypothetical protein